ncbi:hypothetical protein L9F63_027199, partial [Diploptera punctata]
LEKIDDEEFVQDIILMIASEVTTRQQADKLVQLMEENDIEIGLGDESINEIMEEEITWTEKHYDTIANWLREYVSNRMTR